MPPCAGLALAWAGCGGQAGQAVIWGKSSVVTVAMAQKRTR